MENHARHTSNHAPQRFVDVDECPRFPDKELLFQQFQPLVRGLLRRYGRTPELRKDLTGEIYCQFSRLVDSYDPDRAIPICAYLTHMLPQRIFNYVRDFWRGESRYITLDQETVEATEVFSQDDSMLWNETLMAEEILNALPSAIAKLPHRQRLVLVWRYYEELSFEQIAEQLSIKPPTARSLLRHAITSLRNRLAQQGLVD